MARPDYYQLALRISKTQSDRWRAAADAAGMLYRDWAINHLDAAAITPDEHTHTDTQHIAQQRSTERTAGHPRICGCGDCLSRAG